MTIQITDNDTDYWAIVPAAGLGLRVGAGKPKQYLTIYGKAVIEHTLDRLLNIAYLQKLVVVIDQNDTFWPNIGYANHPRIMTVIGGNERADSVLNGLLALRSQVKNQDWVLVHDAARPCIWNSDIDKLKSATKDHAIGGLLGCRTRDTMKAVNQQYEVTKTLDRNQVWHALTPQIFRFKLLLEALQTVQGDARLITDEASAIEALGYQPLMVEGRSDNIKVTNPEDLKLAEYYLSQHL